jgi:hypothetical protein
MGRENVDLAHERWGSELHGGLFRALAWMALRSWDIGQERNGDLPRRYWGGHPLLAFGMGLVEKRDATLTKSQAERVRRAVRDLAKKGAITVVHAGYGQQHAVYELQLDLTTPLWKPPDQLPLNPSGSDDHE